MIKVGIIGFGYWGPNLLRNFSANPGFRVIAVCDSSEASRARARQSDRNVALYDDALDLINDPEIEAVVIATPVGTHFDLARRALQRFKHVLVEKPMCASVEQGKELVELADRVRRVLMVDHTYLFHGVVKRLRHLIDNRNLGNVSYFDSVRINLGLFQPDMNVLWDLAPHDFSIMDYLFDEEPVHVEATGYCHVNLDLPDLVYVTMHFPSRMIAHFHLSWMSPVKLRRIAIGGASQMAVWDDLNPEEKLKIYDSGIEFQPEAERSVIVPEYRIGDVLSPRIRNQEALVGIVEHFRRVIQNEEPSILDGRAGLRVVKLLERTQQVLDRNLSMVHGMQGLSEAQRITR